MLLKSLPWQLVRQQIDCKNILFPSAHSWGQVSVSNLMIRYGPEHYTQAYATW